MFLNSQQAQDTSFYGRTKIRDVRGLGSNFNYKDLTHKIINGNIV